MKKKIIILFLALFLFFLGGIFTALYIIMQTTSNLDALITLHKVEIIRQELVINVQTVQSNLYTTGTLFGKELDVIVNNVLNLRDGVRRCASCHHEPDVDEGIQELRELTEQYKEALSYFITSTADKARIERLQAVAADIGDTIISKSQAMALTANESLRKRTIAATERINRSKLILAYTIILAFIISAAIAVYLIRSITRPVSELLLATRKIRGGELGFTSLYPGRDEFKELFDSFNAMSRTLKETNEKILSHMARNQTILQTSIDGFVLFDEAGRILDVNPALCERSGFSRDELLEMKFTDLEVLDPEMTLESLLAGIKESGSMIFEMSQRTKHGSLINVEISATFTEMDGLGSFFCFIRDITERKKMAAELLRVQKLESLGVLAGGIAHDFNNLLTGILGNIDLAMRHPESVEKLTKWLGNAKKASGRAQGLTQQLLTFSRGGAPIKQPVLIAELIEDSTRFVLSGSNVRCEYSLPEDLWLVEVDKGQIGQVLQNITINADQGMPNGGTIRISAENIRINEGDLLNLAGGDYVKIVITDEGIGIEEKFLTKIFDPYFSTKKSGNGLGLTICYSIVKKHKGLIVADSKVGVGSAFTIYLPAKSADKSHSVELAADSVIRGTGKVLVMDDEEQVREIVGDMLSHLGYQPEFAIDGVETIKMYGAAMATGNPYRLVMMDLTIPGGMGGREAIAELRRLDPEVKAVVSSGYSYDPIMAEYGKFGFSGVVSKPYDVVQLGKTLNDILKE